MAVYVVTWNLNREGANYDAKRRALIERLAQYDSTRDPGLESVVFLSTPANVVDVTADLLRGLDANDRLLVSQMNIGQARGLLFQPVWEWINARV